MSESTAELSRRVAALERRIAAMTGEDGRGDRPPASIYPSVPDADRFWALDVLRTRTGPPFEADGAGGSVLFAGTATTKGAGCVVWQEEHPLPSLLGQDWNGAAAVLSALGHPIRLELIRRLLTGAHTTHELAEIPDLGTSGQLYHHLRELQTAGLVEQRRRNHYVVPADRVILCLVMITAARSGSRIAPEPAHAD